MRANALSVYLSHAASQQQGSDVTLASSLPSVRQHLIFQRSNAGATAAWTFEVEGAGLAPGIVIPMQSARYLSLFRAIRLLATDDDLDDEAVDGGTAQDAWRVLSTIESRNLPAPQIFSHSGTAIVFSWDLPRVSRYLTISHGAAAVLDIDRHTKMKCRYAAETISEHKVLSSIKGLGVPHAATNPS